MMSDGKIAELETKDYSGRFFMTSPIGFTWALEVPRFVVVKERLCLSQSRVALVTSEVTLVPFRKMQRLTVPSYREKMMGCNKESGRVRPKFLSLGASVLLLKSGKEMNLSGKVVLITGGGQGIGSAIAR